MTRLRIVLAISVGLGVAAAAVVALSQSTSAGPPSATLKIHLQAERLQMVTSVRGLPLGVRDELQRLFGRDGLDIGDAGADFQKSGMPATTTLPSRRLVAAGCANDGHCLVYYEKGGTPITQRVALFTWTPATTKLEWGGVAPRGLTTIEDVRKAIVAGVIKGGQGEPW